MAGAVTFNVASPASHVTTNVTFCRCVSLSTRAMHPSVLPISFHRAIEVNGMQLADSFVYIFAEMTHSSDDDKNAALLDRRTFFIGTASALALGTTACGGGSSGSFSPIGGATAQQPTQQSPGANPVASASTDTPAAPDTPAPEPTTPEPQVRKIAHPGLLVTDPTCSASATSWPPRRSPGWLA